MIPIIAAIVSFLAGLALAYWLLEKRLSEQKQNHVEQTRKITEEIERSHQSRIQQTVQSLQTEHENRVKQLTQELEQTYATRMQDAIQSLQEQHDAHLIQVTDELQRNHETRLRETVNSLQVQHESQLKQTTEELQIREAQLQTEYEGQLRQVTEELARSYDAEKQAIINQLQAEYEAQLRQLNTELDRQELQIQSTLEELHEELPPPGLILPEEAPPMPVVEATLTQDFDNGIAEPTQEVLDSSVIITEPTQEILDPPVVITEPTQEVLDSPVVSAPLILPAQDLHRKIVALGNSGVTFIPELIRYAGHPEAQIRELVAASLGKIAASNSLRAEVQRAIPILSQLTQDRVPQVRQKAVEALGNIRSEKVIPLLQKALRDSDGKVVQAAYAAFNKFKFRPGILTTKPKTIQMKKPKR